jgi:hypothetical protein
MLSKSKITSLSRITKIPEEHLERCFRKVTSMLHLDLNKDMDKLILAMKKVYKNAKPPV